MSKFNQAIPGDREGSSASNPLVGDVNSNSRGSDANLDSVSPSWPKKSVDTNGDDESEDEVLLNRASRGSIASRMSGARLSTTEFENAPHKLAHEINPEEARKWLDPYSKRNRGIFASYLAVGFGLFFIQVSISST